MTMNPATPSMTSKLIRITLLAAVALFCSSCGFAATVPPNSVSGAKLDCG